MKTILGDKEKFGILIDIRKKHPLSGKFALLLCGEQIGRFKDSEYLHYGMATLKALIQDPNSFYDGELKDADAVEMFKRIHPFYNNPEDFYDLTPTEQEALVKWDKYILSWGWT